MYKIAVVGDYDSIYGFGTLGLDTFPIKDAEEGRHLLRRLAANDYGIIYITEELAGQVGDVIEEYASSLIPAIIQIPGIKGNTGAGVNNVKKSVEQAVGSDILFGGVSAEEGDTK